MSPDELLPDWRRAARAELRRSRRYLLALAQDVPAADLEWIPPRQDASCIKWHVGHVALSERRLLAQLVPGLRVEEPDGALRFGRQAMHDRGTEWPSWQAVLDMAQAMRRLTLSLLETLSGAEGAEVFRAIVNAEYSQARFVRRTRRELGLPDVPEPHGALVEADTDVDAAPLFHVPTWGSVGRSDPAEVVSMAEHRQGRAQELLERGQAAVAAGDYRAALRAFEDSAAIYATADALTYQGWMHTLMGNVERAEKLCLEAIALDPEFGNPYNDLGTIKLQHRDVAGAIKWFERAKRARRYEPRHFPFVNLGKLYLSLGLPERALREFEGALSHSPANQEVRDAVESLRRQLDGGGGER